MIDRLQMGIDLNPAPVGKRQARCFDPGARLPGNTPNHAVHGQVLVAIGVDLLVIHACHIKQGVDSNLPLLQ